MVPTRGSLVACWDGIVLPVNRTGVAEGTTGSELRPGPRRVECSALVSESTVLSCLVVALVPSLSKVGNGCVAIEVEGEETGEWTGKNW